jgi:hypothetical protein
MPPAPFKVEAVPSLNLLMLGTMLTLLTPRNAAIALPVILNVVALVKFIAAAVLLRSWALLLWINSEALLGMLLGMLLLLLLLWLKRPAAIVSGAVVALVYFIIVNFVFGDSVRR